jgi:ABC-type lipoprotein release transport system permease subunit
VQSRGSEPTVSRKRLSGRWPGLEFFIAARLVGSRKKSYVSLVSAVSVWGLALGVASLVVIFAITSGFEEVFRDKLLGVYPHLVVIGKGGDLPDWEEVRTRLTGKEGLTSVSPATYDEMMASHRGRRAGSIVKGIESTSRAIIETVEPFVVDGTPADLHIEPEVALAGGILRVSRLPGGADFMAALLPDGSVEWFASFEEEDDVPRVRLYLAGQSSVDVEVSGILTDHEFTLEPGAMTMYLDVPEGATAVTLDGLERLLEVGPGNHTFVVVDSSSPLLHCPNPRPEASGRPATLCVANATRQVIKVELPSSTDEVAPGTATSLEEAMTVKPTVLLGEELARTIEAEIGDEIRLVSPLFSVPGVSTGRRKGRTIADTFIVKGIIRLGFFEYDSKLALVDYSVARRFLHQGDVARWVEVRVDDLFLSNQRGVEMGRILSDFSLLDVAESYPVLDERYNTIASGLSAAATAPAAIENVSLVISAVKFSNLRGEMALGYRDDHRIITWEEMNKPLFSSMKRQRIVLSLFFMIIIVVAAFNIVSSQVMIINEKSPDIAILKAMGAGRQQVRRIFLLQGMSIGVVGTLGGILIASLVCVLLDKVGFPLDPEVYFVSQLPVNLQWTDIVTAAVMSLVFIFVAVSVAARRAAEKSPVEGLRELE